MTRLLEQAFQEAAKLDEQEQDAFARWILEELDAEQRWEKLWADSQNELALLAQEALQEHRNGQTKPFDLESL